MSEKRDQSDGPGKDKIRNPGMNALEKSDRPVVPGKTENKAAERYGVAEPLEGRGRTKEKAEQNAMGSTQSGSAMGSGLDRLRQRAKEDKNTRFTALLHHVTVDLLRDSFLHLQRNSAPGVDGVTWKEYEQGLEGRLIDLHGRVHRGSYRAQPSRRVYIPKPDGRKRPLGIASLEDKIVQQAVVVVLNAIYENDFLGFSYGFRPGKKAHDALDALSVALQFEETGWVLDADIQGFYDNMSHEWTLAFLERRIADPRVLRLIQKWLRAGVSEDGEWSRTTIGTPQGAVISPLLANVYLHYVFDLWAQQWRQESCAGAMFIIRYADDVVVAFQYRGDAVRFHAELVEQMRAHGLELHPEKTRLIEFGRFAEQKRKRSGDGLPDTFDFLGFTHICSRSRGGKFFIKRRTVAKKMRATLARVKQELYQRMHEPVKETGKWLGAVVSGYYQYFCVPGNLPMMARFRHRVTRLWRRVLIRRGGQRKPSWERLTPLFERWLPHARVLHPYPVERFSAKYPRWEPYAGKPPVRFCPGGAS